MLIASWPIAFALSPFLTFQTVRVTYNDDATASGVRNASIAARNYVHYSARETKSKSVTLTELIDSGIWFEPMALSDSWGRQLKAVTDDNGYIKSMKHSPMFYSTGLDGKSATAGNDPDDINSWDDHQRPFYNARLSRFALRTAVWRTVLATPVVFGILWCILAAATRRSAT